MKAFGFVAGVLVIAVTPVILAIVGVFAQTGTPQPADIVIGSASGVPGQTVSIPIVINTQAQLANAFDLNLAFDGATFPGSTGVTGSEPLPVSWLFTANEAAAGDLRYLGAGFTPIAGDVLAGEILRAEIRIALGALPGTYPITASLARISNALDGDLPVIVADGAITVLDLNLRLNTVTMIVLPSPALEVFDRLEARPRDFTAEVGSTVQLSGWRILSDGSEVDITADVIWISLNPAVATVTETGLVVFVSEGTVGIAGGYAPR